jgi:hypothetical protein
MFTPIISFLREDKRQVDLKELGYEDMGSFSFDQI